jgi:hypothetical protein
LSISANLTASPLFSTTAFAPVDNLSSSNGDLSPLVVTQLDPVGQQQHHEAVVEHGQDIFAHAIDVVPHPDGSIWFTDPPYGGNSTRRPRCRGRGEAIPKGTSIRGSSSRRGSRASSANRSQPLDFSRVSPAALMKH